MMIETEHPVTPRVRWDIDSPNPHLYRELNSHRFNYMNTLRFILEWRDKLVQIPQHPAESDPAGPYWVNGFIPGLDAVTLYGFTAQREPRIYLEIGSGNSTKFVRKAITDVELNTRIISIDPHPRAEVDSICDEVHRLQLQEVDLKLFDQLRADDIVFMDGSHYVFQNSDVVTFMLDVLPRLRPGVLVGIHDILLPYDYPQAWHQRHYSEQYLLAASLLAGHANFNIVLPNSFVTYDKVLHDVLRPLWDDLPGIEHHGSIFWFVTV